MTWILSIVLVVVFFMVLGILVSKIGNKKLQEEAALVAQKVKNNRQYEKLSDKAQTAYFDAKHSYGKKKHELKEKSDMLEMARELAFEKLSFWQYIPDLELDTSLQELRLVGKKITNDEKDSYKSLISSNYWYRVTPDDEFEELLGDEKSYLSKLIKAREVLESDIDDNEKLVRISKLLKIDQDEVEAVLLST